MNEATKALSDDRDGTVGYEGKFGFNCPYCLFTALRPPFYYWHLAEEHAEQIRNSNAFRDVPYKGMAIMARTHLDIMIERERRKIYPPLPMPDEVEAVPARIFGREVVTIPVRYVPASWVSDPDSARIALSLGALVFVVPSDLQDILTKYQKASSDSTHFE
jgi:hypothetical protein